MGRLKRRGAFGLVAVAPRETPGPATEATAPRAGRPRSPKPQDYDDGRARITQHGTRGAGGRRPHGASPSTGAGACAYAEVRNWTPAGMPPLRVTPGPLFRLELGDLKLTSRTSPCACVAGRHGYGRRAP